MPVTSLVIKDKEHTKYLQISTTPDEKEGGLIVVFTEMDEKFEFEKGKDGGVDKRTEEEYHTQLRVAAAIKNQLITSHSTDPEWNPEGYVKNLDDGK